MIDFNGFYIPQTDKFSILDRVKSAADNSPTGSTNEFAEMFFREILKQSFSDLFGSDKKENNPYHGITREYFIEQFAKELALKNKSFNYKIGMP